MDTRLFLTIGAIAVTSSILPTPISLPRPAEDDQVIKFAVNAVTPEGGTDATRPAGSLFTLNWIVAARSTVASNPAPNSYSAEVIVRRISEVAALEDGWVGPKSLAPSTHVLTWLRDHTDLIAASRHVISIVPVADGAVALQWSDGPVEFTAELSPDRHMHLYADNTATDEFDEIDRLLDAAALASFISTGKVG